MRVRLQDTVDGRQVSYAVRVGRDRSRRRDRDGGGKHLKTDFLSSQPPYVYVCACVRVFARACVVCVLYVLACVCVRARGSVLWVCAWVCVRRGEGGTEVRAASEIPRRLRAHTRQVSAAEVAHRASHVIGGCW